MLVERTVREKGGGGRLKAAKEFYYKLWNTGGLGLLLTKGGKMDRYGMVRGDFL